MKGAAAIAAILAAIALQTTLSSLMLQRGTVLDLVLIVVVYVAIKSGPVTGVLAGTVAGLNGRQNDIDVEVRVEDPLGSTPDAVVILIGDLVYEPDLDAYRTNKVTGWLKTAGGKDLGFQITFFRARPDLDAVERRAMVAGPRDRRARHGGVAEHEHVLSHRRVVHPERSSQLLCGTGTVGSEQQVEQRTTGRGRHRVCAATCITMSAVGS